MGWPDNCLYWQPISSLIAVQHHCQPLIMAGTALSDTLTPQWCVRSCAYPRVRALVCTHTSASTNYRDVCTHFFFFLFVFMSAAEKSVILRKKKIKRFSPLVSRLAPQRKCHEKGESMKSPSPAVYSVSNSVDGALR